MDFRNLSSIAAPNWHQKARSFLLFPLGLILLFGLLNLLTACTLPQVSAEDRLYLDLSLQFVDASPLPQPFLDETAPGHFSALTYDRQQNQFYALAKGFRDARFYPLKLALQAPDSETAHSETAHSETAALNTTTIGPIQVGEATVLTQGNDNPPEGNFEAAGIALSPQQSVFALGEWVDSEGIVPTIDEFDLKTGKQRQRLPLPNRYLPNLPDRDGSDRDRSDRDGADRDLPNTSAAAPPQGVQDNRGLTALTLSPGGALPAAAEPFRLFAATAAPLEQNRDRTDSRLLHYLLSDGPPLLIAEHLYPLETDATGAVTSNLVDVVALDQGGHFLSLERADTPLGRSSSRIFQLAIAGATDISTLPDQTALTGVIPIRKRLLLDLNDPNLPQGTLTGMTLGQRLPDGSQSLWLLSNENVGKASLKGNRDQPTTQLLLFRLR